MVLISLIPGPHNTWQPQLRITVPIFFFGGGASILKEFPRFMLFYSKDVMLSSASVLINF